MYFDSVRFNYIFILLSYSFVAALQFKTFNKLITFFLF